MALQPSIVLIRLSNNPPVKLPKVKTVQEARSVDTVSIISDFTRVYQDVARAYAYEVNTVHD